MESQHRLELRMSMVVRALLFTCLLAHCGAKKESVDTKLTKEDAELLFKIIKRIGDTDYNYPSDDSDQSAHDSYGKQSSSKPSDQQHAACIPTIKQGVIIKATESINRGADYIASIKGVASNADCIDYCCRNSSCDVAVYQDKKDHYCYLFRCEDKCEFKDFSGYFATDIRHKASEQSEQDLQSLNTEVASDSSPEGRDGQSQDGNGIADQAPDTEKQEAPVPPDQIDETTPRAPAPTPTDAPEPIIAPHSVGLRGFCRQDRHCEDPNAACIQRNCMCHQGYYNKEGLCRKVCPPSNFECFELGTLSRGPECVPRDQVCDSYMQCADGSDEFNCEGIAPNPKQKSWSEQQKPDWSQPNANSQGDGNRDPYTAPVLQQPANSKQPAQAGPQGASTYNTDLGPGNHGNSGQMAGAGENMPAQPGSHVRPTPVVPRPSAAGMESSMRLNQNPNPNNAPPARVNPSGTNGYAVPQQPGANNVNTNPSLSQPTNPDYAPTNNQPVSPGGLSEHMQPSANANQQYDHAPPANLPPHNDRAQSGPTNPYQGSGQNYNPPSQPASQEGSPGQGQATNVQNAAPNRAYSEGGSYKKFPVQAKGQPIMNNQQQKVYPGVSSGGQTAANRQRPQSSGPAHSGNEPPRQNSHHYDQALPSSAKLGPSSSLLSSPSKSVGSNRPKGSSSQGSSKSYSSSLSPADSQNRQQLPSYSNSQKWLDPSLYMPYGLGDSSSQPQQPMGSRFYESSQYYPPYASDNLDALPESLLGNAGSADDFSQFGNPYLTQDKPYSSSYQGGNQNSGFLGYPETPYGGQYPTGNRYDYNGEYRPSGYQEQDYYPSLGSQQAYRPSAGLYEEFPSQVGQHKPSSVNKPQAGGHSVGSVPESGSEHKSGSWTETGHGGQASAVKPTSQPSQASPKVTTSKSKSSSATQGKTEKPMWTTTARTSEGKQEPSKHVYMSREKVIIASSTSNAEGPIIALSLGLAFTLILIVLLGCRLRNMRHRLRKGRPLHQNEADYLINGMYL